MVIHLKICEETFVNVGGNGTKQAEWEDAHQIGV